MTTLTPTASPSASPARARFVPVVPAALAVVAAGLAFQRVFTLGHTVGPVMVSAVLGTAAGLVGRVALTPPEPATPPSGVDAAWLVHPEPATTVADPAALAVAATSLLLAVLVAPVVVAAAFTTPRPGAGGAFGQGIGALFGAWSRILTTSVPVPPTVDRLPLLAGIVAAAAAAAVLLASRARPGLAALVPAVGVLVLGLALGVHGPGSLGTVVGPLTVAATAYLLLTSRPAEGGATWVPPARTLAAAVSGTVILVVVLAVGAHLPLGRARPPADLRSTLSPPLALGSTPNPLDQLPARQAAGGSTLFTATVDRTWLASPLHWRLATLDVYSGAGWTTDAQARRAGNVLPAPAGVDPAALGPSTSVTVDLSGGGQSGGAPAGGGLAGTGGPWVPTTGIPTGVAPGDLQFDPASSTLLRDCGTTPCDAHATAVPATPAAASAAAPGHVFHLTSRLPQPTRRQLDQAGLSSGAADAVLTAVPSCLPAPLRRLAASATSGLARPDQLAVALEQALATGAGYRLAPGATSGSSCGRLRAFVAAKEGTVEQFATAFALMARTVGLPARVAVGFTPGEVDATAGTTTVHGRDATVWPEIDFASLGWVAFDPVPSAAGPANQGGGAAATTTTVSKGDQGLSQVRRTVNQHAAQTTPQGQHTTGPLLPTSGQRSGPGRWWWAIAAAGVLGVAAGVAATRVVRRRRRRQRRRQHDDPAGRVTGAWAEVLDALAPLGVATSSLTPTEVQAATVDACEAAAPPVAAVAGAVDRAVYAGLADPPMAEAAWVASDRAVHLLRQAVPPGRRARYLLTGGPRT